MSMIDSLLPMSNNNSNNNKYYDYGSPTSSHGSFLLSPSSSSSILNKNSNSSNNYSILQTILPGEEISTIFVVGFPDNMQEREFQNMFMFSPGFEAATLKVPNSGTISTTNTTVEDESNRKQIIGFAKFRTRLEALDAKEILNGKKIDQERGCILKAEMAKKNLHTKKEIQQATAAAAANTVKTPYEAFHSVPTSIIKNDFSPSTSPPPPNNNIMPTSTRSTSFTLSSNNNNNMSNIHRYSTKSNIIDNHHHNNGLFGMMGNKKASTVYPTSTLSSSSLSSSSASMTDYPFLLHKLYNKKTSSSASSPPPLPPIQPSLHHDDIISSHLLSQLVVSSASTPILSMDNSSSTDYYNIRQQSNNNNISPNNIDQNPPCNTLYVGNLPMNTSEEELRIMFSKCLGYKRLSFRTKSNGPMCFVEFEDIQYATLALQELHGNPLSNSVKGGIRLSFSKNPLGVRQNIVPSLNNTK